jgi:hypothetical protein
MCDCQEIQGQRAEYRQWHDGDFMVDRDSWKCNPDDAVRCHCESCDMEYGHWQDDPNAIWLPRQDQLQEMMLAPSMLRLEHLYAEARADINYGLHGLAYDSMEQFWLMIVMWYVHGKLWRRHGERLEEACWWEPGPDDHLKNCGSWVERAARRGWQWAVDRKRLICDNL